METPLNSIGRKHFNCSACGADNDVVTGACFSCGGLRYSIVQEGEPVDTLCDLCRPQKENQEVTPAEGTEEMSAESEKTEEDLEPSASLPDIQENDSKVPDSYAPSMRTNAILLGVALSVILATWALGRRSGAIEANQISARSALLRSEALGGRQIRFSPAPDFPSVSESAEDPNQRALQEARQKIIDLVWQSGSQTQDYEAKKATEKMNEEMDRVREQQRLMRKQQEEQQEQMRKQQEAMLREQSYAAESARIQQEAMNNKIKEDNKKMQEEMERRKPTNWECAYCGEGTTYSSEADGNQQPPGGVCLKRDMRSHMWNRQ